MGRIVATILPFAATAAGALALLVLSLRASSGAAFVLAICYGVVCGVAAVAHVRRYVTGCQWNWFATGFTLAATVIGAASFGPALLPALLLWVAALVLDRPMRNGSRLAPLLAAFFGATFAALLVVTIAYLS